MKETGLPKTVSAIITRGHKILLQKHVKNKGRWILPAGKVEDSEDLMIAVIREMKEELGIDIKYKDVDKIRIHGDNGRIITCDRIEGIKHYDNYTFSIFQYDGKIQNLEPEKHTDIKWFSREEILEMLLNGETYDYVYDATYYR